MAVSQRFFFAEQLFLFIRKTEYTDGERFVNIHSVVYTVGHLDYATGKYTTEYVGEVDGGFDFYAPQVIKTPDGRNVMTAWMQMWDRDYITAPDGYVGCMIFPREIGLKNGRLYQMPAREIEAFRQNGTELACLTLNDEAKRVEAFDGNCSDISFKMDIGTSKRCGIKLFEGKDCELKIYFDRRLGSVVLDRGGCGKVIQGAYPETDFKTRKVKVLPKELLSFRILLDKTGVEVFINDGEATMTANVYPDEGATSVSFFAEDGEGTVMNGIKYDIVVS